MRLILAILALIPVLLGLGYYLFWMNLATELVVIVDQDASSGPAMNSGISVLELWSDYETAQRAKAILDTDSLSLARSVEYRVVLPIEAFLDEGEVPPELYLHDLYAEARSAGLVQAECARLLATIARSCATALSATNRHEDGGYEVQARLIFAPADPIGNLPAGAQLDYQSDDIRMDEESLNAVAPADLGAAREVYYRRAAQACAAIRQSSGACVIEKITIDTRRARGNDGALDVEASVTLATFRPGG